MDILRPEGHRTVIKVGWHGHSIHSTNLRSSENLAKSQRLLLRVSGNNIFAMCFETAEVGIFCHIDRNVHLHIGPQVESYIHKGFIPPES